MVFGIESLRWFVVEGFVVEPAPVAVDIGRIGDNDVEFARDLVEKVGLDEVDFCAECFGVLLGDGKGFFRDIGAGDTEVWVLQLDRNSYTSRTST